MRLHRPYQKPLFWDAEPEGSTLPAAALSQARALLSELLLAVLEAEKQRHPARREVHDDTD